MENKTKKISAIQKILRTPKIAFQAVSGGRISPSRFRRNLRESFVLAGPLYFDDLKTGTFINWKIRFSERKPIDKVISGVRYGAMGYIANNIVNEAMAQNADWERVVALSVGLAAMPLLYLAQRVGGQFAFQKQNNGDFNVLEKAPEKIIYRLEDEDENVTTKDLNFDPSIIFYSDLKGYRQLKSQIEKTLEVKGDNPDHTLDMVKSIIDSNLFIEDNDGSYKKLYISPNKVHVETEKGKGDFKLITGNGSHINAPDTVSGGLQCIQLGAFGLWPYLAMGLTFIASSGAQTAMRLSSTMKRSRDAVTNTILGIGIPFTLAAGYTTSNTDMTLLAGVLLPALYLGARAGAQTIEKLHRTMFMHAGANASVVGAATLATASGVLEKPDDLVNILVMYGAGTLGLARTLQDIAPRFRVSDGPDGKEALNFMGQVRATFDLVKNPNHSNLYYFPSTSTIRGKNIEVKRYNKKQDLNKRPENKVPLLRIV